MRAAIEGNKAVSATAIGARTDQASHLGVGFENFENAYASAIAGTAAALAADRVMHGFAEAQAEHGVARIGPEIIRGEPVRFLASFAKHADKPLRNHRAQCRLQQEVFDVQIEETRN
jgi:hypothetical protein